MNKSICFFSIFQLLLCQAAFGQSVKWSNKIIQSGDVFTSVVSGDEFLQVQNFNQKSKTTDILELNSNLMYNGKFDYNPIPFDVNAQREISTLSLVSVDGFWTNPQFVKITAKNDAAKISDANYNIRLVGGHSSPLDHQMLTYTNESADRDRNLYFDMSCGDKDVTFLYLYMKDKKELQLWSFDGRQTIKDTVMADAYKLYWKNTANYSVELTDSFTAFEMNGKHYLIAHDGTLFELGRELTRVKKLSASLVNSKLIINKDTNSVYYMPGVSEKGKFSLPDVSDKKKVKIEF